MTYWTGKKVLLRQTPWSYYTFFLDWVGNPRPINRERPSREALGLGHSTHCGLWPKTPGFLLIRIILITELGAYWCPAQRFSSSKISKHNHRPPASSARGNWTEQGGTGAAQTDEENGQFQLSDNLAWKALTGQCQMPEPESPMFCWQPATWMRK